MRKLLLCITLLSVLWIGSAFGQQVSFQLYTDEIPSRAVAEIAVPEGFACLSGDSGETAADEYYFLPTDESSPVRFLYYTVGEGDPGTLAQAALSSYSMLYDTFSAGEIHTEEFAGLPFLFFDYTCAYPNRAEDALVYEQTVISYISLDSDTFIACIVSLAFDNPDDYLSAEAMRELLDFALNAVKIIG